MEIILLYYYRSSLLCEREENAPILIAFKRMNYRRIPPCSISELMFHRLRKNHPWNSDKDDVDESYSCGTDRPVRVRSVHRYSLSKRGDRVFVHVRASARLPERERRFKNEDPVLFQART